jgi:quercetin dioxygenase-like cupin family protein
MPHENLMSELPKLIRDLPKFAGPFDAHKLQAAGCDVLFASYPAGTVIAAHQHDTENVGIITKGSLLLTIDSKETRFVTGEWYHIPARAEHAARFDEESSEIEFWFHRA